MGDLSADFDLLRRRVGASWLARDVVRISGPGAVAFLQGQTSQDVVQLALGASAWSWVLQPQGKVDALIRVTRVADDTMVADTDGGWGEALIVRLNRFKLRVKADIEALDWRCLALRGPDAGGYRVDTDTDGVDGLEGVDGRSLVVDAGWPGLPGVDLLGAAPVLPPGVAMVDPAAFEAARIYAGVPRLGAELTDRTIPNETGLIDRTVSFTKGCYTGQELVARIDSRGGNVPRTLRGVVLAGPAPVGAAIVVGDKTVGTLTSVVGVPGGSGAVGLAYVGRTVVPPAAAQARWDGGKTDAGIESLPFWP
jgi:folate-binding protein YgfZ